MKRLILVLLSWVCVTCLLPNAALASGLPGSVETLQAKTDEELLSMYHEIQFILLSRSQSYSLDLNAGRYVIGKDIPAGTYRIECKGAYSSASLTIYDNDSSSYGDVHLLAELYNSSVLGKIELNTGNILDIDGSRVSITSYAATDINISYDGSRVPNTAASEAQSPEKFILSPGKYNVGDEIPAGTYRIECKSAYGMANFQVFDSKTALFPSYSVILSELFGNAVIGKIELEAGTYVVLEEGDVTFYPYNGIE